MTISTYGELKTAVAVWANRSDLTSVIPDFIALAEADIRTDVRCQAMEQYATGTLTGETLAHPTGYLSAKTLVVDEVRADYITPDHYLALGDSSTAGVFTSIGQDLYIKGGTNGLAYRLVFYKAFTPMSSDADFNWLLTNAPGIYLAGACRYAALYMKDTEEETKFAGMYASNVARLNSQEQRGKAPSSLQVRAR